MSYGFLEIDHLLAADDPNVGGSRYERLGFTITPLSIIEELGVANRLVLLHPFTKGTANFFECMGVVDSVRATGNPMGALLAGEAGIRSMVLSSADAQASFESLSSDGFPFDRLIDVEREWELPDGEVLKPSFRVTLPIDAPLRFNFCEYRTPELYLRDAWLRHENGARHLTKVFAVADDPAAVAHYFERVFAGKSRHCGAMYSVAPGGCELHVGNAAALGDIVPTRWVPHDCAAPRYVGFEVQVQSLATVHDLLRTRDVEFEECGTALIVAPGEACGNVLRFVETRT